MRSTLQSPRVRRIVGAYSLNRLGGWLGSVAISLAVYDHTHSAIAVSALLVAGQVLPAFLVPAFVARVEVSARRSELSSLYWFEAVATAALAVLIWNFSLPAVLLVATLDGTAGLAASALLRTETARAARDEVRAAATTETREDSSSLEEEALAAERQANATLNVAFSAAFMLGPAIAGAVVAWAGAPTGLLMDAFLFVVCGALLAQLRPHVQEAGGDSVRARLYAAWRHINDVPALRGLLLAEAVALVFFAAGEPIELFYAKATLDAGARGYGFLLAVWGVGVVLGSVVFARSARRPVGAMLTAGTLAVGLAYCGFAAAPSLVLACVAAVLGGVGNGIQWASLISAVQQLTPQDLLGRLMGAIESLGALCPAIGLLLGGALISLSTPRTAFLVIGLGAIAITVAFLRLALGGLKPDTTVSAAATTP